jgi:genome maintenance exonuclease 1
MHDQTTSSDYSKYPTVTQILDATMPNEKRAAQEAWKMRVGEEEAERIRQAAIERGNEIDANVLRVKDGQECTDVRISKYLDGYEIVAHEMRVHSDMHQYRGRFDAVLQMNGRNILVDWKGSGRWKQKKYLADYRLQLGAYFGALVEMGWNIDCAKVVLFVDGMDRPQVYWQQPDELWSAHEEFVKRLKQYRAEIEAQNA